jgi:hypothetical protein
MSSPNNKTIYKRASNKAKGGYKAPNKRHNSTRQKFKHLEPLSPK